MRPSPKSVVIRLAVAIPLLVPCAVQSQEVSRPGEPQLLRRHLIERFEASSHLEERIALLKRLSSMKRASRAPARRAHPRTSGQPNPQSILAPYKHLFGTVLDEAGLGRKLVTLLRNHDRLLMKVFDELEPTDRDDVAFEIVHRMGDQELRSIARRPEGKRFLHRLANEMNRGFVSGREVPQVLRLLRVLSPTHASLAEDLLPGPVARALSVSGTKHQSIRKGSGFVRVDEFAITIERMPPGITPERFLREMAHDLNGTVDDREFDRINTFHRRTNARNPRPGEILDINILGPDNGAVVLRNQAADHFVFSTIETPRTGTHPEYGNRAFGFQNNPDGTITFYTRGVSRPADPAVGVVGAWPQTRGWTRLMRGIGNTIESRGGRVQPHSFRIRKGF